MFRQTSTDKLAKKVKVFLDQRKIEQRPPHKSAEWIPGERSGDLFVKSIIDPRLTAEENAVLIQRLIEVREAFIAMILSNREVSHGRDMLAG